MQIYKSLHLQDYLFFKKRPIPIQEEQKEYLAIYTTQFSDIYMVECFTSHENQLFKEEAIRLTEEEFELNVNYSREDLNARIEEKIQLVKIRRLDKSICDNLKLLYNYKCQITGENFSEFLETSVVEAHHIDYFTNSWNNNADNILILSPNYHRLIHKLNPTFDKKELVFVFPNGYKEKIKLNKHI